MADVTVRAPTGELYTGDADRVSEFQRLIPGAQVLSAEEAAAQQLTATIREEES